MTQHWFHPRGSLARDGWEVVVDDALPGWEHTGVRVGAPGPDGLVVPTGVEKVVVPLSGPVTVTLSGEGGDDVVHLAGRADVFEGPTDVLYVSTTQGARVSGPGRVAVATSPTPVHHPTRHVRREEVPVELRGAGRSSRQVHNYGTPQALDAERLIVCEVLTPSENWSSYPPHKHDEHRPGTESRLEEIYYFESAPARVGGAAGSPQAAFGMFATYSSAAGEIAIDSRVRTGDVALVPHGYHGPAVAAPGYDLYYLNVMAGPDPERVWHITDDPDHAWVRGTWEGQAVDDRLPYLPPRDRPGSGTQEETR